MIEFTQYMHPEGKTKKTFFAKTTPETEKKARQLIENGFEFSVEVLNGDLVAVYCEDLANEDRYCMQVCYNGSDVVPAVNKLIEESYSKFAMEK